MKGLLTEMCSGRAGVGAVLRGKRGTSLQEVVSTGPGAAEEGCGMPRPRGTGQGRRCGGHRLAQVRGELPRQAKWGRGTPPLSLLASELVLVTPLSEPEVGCEGRPPPICRGHFPAERGTRGQVEPAPHSPCPRWTHAVG